MVDLEQSRKTKYNNLITLFEEPTENCIEEVAVSSSLSLRRKTVKIYLISKKKQLSTVANSIIIIIIITILLIKIKDFQFAYVSFVC